MNEVPEFDRRRFLVLAGATCVVAGAGKAQRDDVRPGATDAQGKASTETPLSPLEEAWKRARTSGRPLFVMLTTSEQNPSTRSELWTLYLDLAPDAALADLELCELAFASTAQVAQVWKDVKLWPVVPLALVFVPEGNAARCTSIDDPPSRLQPHLEPREVTRRYHIEIAKLIRRAVLPDAARFEALAKLVLGADAGTHEQSEARLANRCRERLSKEAPAGARWARFGGCGQVLSGKEVLVGSHGPCGTAALGPDARRFLWLYIREPTTVVR